MAPLVGIFPGVLEAVLVGDDVRVGLENLFGLLIFVVGEPFLRVWRVGLGWVLLEFGDC